MIAQASPPSLEKGQGLVEYALILVLVSVAVILILTVAGESIAQLFCKIVTQLDPNATAPICEKISVSCNGSKNGNTVNVEATASNLKQGDSIDYVTFYVDGTVNNTERVSRYCLGQGDANCQPLNINNLSPGTHTVKAAVFTKNGATGTCEFTFTR